MKIEVLYVNECPNHPPTIERIKQVLASENLQVRVREVLVSSNDDAKTLEFHGSPTVRVNGKDVEPMQPGAVGLSCRMYEDFSGMPSVEALKSAIIAAKE